MPSPAAMSKRTSSPPACDTRWVVTLPACDSRWVVTRGARSGSWRHAGTCPFGMILVARLCGGRGPGVTLVAGGHPDGSSAVAGRDGRGGGPAGRRPVPGAARRGVPVAVRRARRGRDDVQPAAGGASAGRLDVLLRPVASRAARRAVPVLRGTAGRDGVHVRRRRPVPLAAGPALSTPALISGGGRALPDSPGRPTIVSAVPQAVGLRRGVPAQSRAGAALRGSRPRPRLPRGAGCLLLPWHVGLAAPGDAPARLPGTGAFADQTARALRPRRRRRILGAGT